MEKILFDSHTHINNDTYTPEGRLELIGEIENSAVGIVMDIGFDMPSSELAVVHANTYPWCYAVVGVHPHDSKTMDEEKYERIRQMVLEDRKGANRIKAIGEIGLDYHYDLSPRDDQRYWFRRQIQLANELKMPIVVHAREADRETMDILIEEGAFSEERKAYFTPHTDGSSDPKVDIHCYSGSAEFAKEYMKLGATFGVDGPLTYKSNHKTVDVVKEVPLSHLLIETDAPYLTPVPFRGKPNKSPYVEYVARKVAEIKGLSYEEAAAATYENGLRFFGIDL